MSGLRRSAPHYRRRILGLGTLAAIVLFSVGFPIVNNRIESDLERRVPAELARAGFAGVSASFDGQDGTLRCAQPLSDPEAATAAAYDVWGVRKITLDRLCRVNRAPTVDDRDTTANGSATATAAGEEEMPSTVVPGQLFDSVGDAVVSEPRLSFLVVLLNEANLMGALDDPASEPVTLFAPTDAAFDALPADVTAQLRSDGAALSEVLAHHITAGPHRADDLAPGPLSMMDGTVSDVGRAGGRLAIDGALVTVADLIAANGVVHVIDSVLLPPGYDLAVEESTAPVAATLAAGIITLTGVVATEVERATLLDAATRAAGDGNVVDELTVDPDVGLRAALAADLAVLLVPLPANLESGAAGFDGSKLYLRGVAVSDEAAAAAAAIAETLDVEPELATRPVATAADASELEQQLNEFVAANPVRFETGSPVLTAGGVAVVDQLAALVQQLTGIAITIEGHTDTDGDATANLALSQQRADAVRSALVERGLDAASITAVGLGEQAPVLLGGVEDKEASRRVEFRVEASG